jgi:hypothetical protein
VNTIAMWFVLAALQVPAAPPAEPAPEAPAFEPYDKSLAEGLDEVRGLSGEKKFDEAYVLCNRLLAPTRFDAWRERQRAEAGWMRRVVAATTPAFDWLGVSGLSPEERAAVHYAEGVVASTARDHAHAEPVFQSARSLAGPGDLRLASIYNLGVNALLDGEVERAKIPELQGGQAAPPASPAAAPGSPGAPPPPDPLDLARAAYVRAKTHLVERVRAHWDDADTRANIELVQRRLKELDEIQKKREEQKKKDEQEKQDKKEQDEKQKSPDDQKKDDEQEQQQKPDESEKKDPKSEEKSEDDKKDQEEPPKPEDAEPSKDEKPEEQKPQPQPSEEALEKLLTKEEMMRLFDVLKQHEEEFDKLKAQMRQSRRAKAKKDW